MAAPGAASSSRWQRRSGCRFTRWVLERRPATCGRSMRGISHAGWWGRSFRRPPGHSVQFKRRAVEFLGPLYLDQHGEAFLVGVAVLFGLDQAGPDRLIDRAGLVDLGGAVKAGNAAFGQDAVGAKLGLAEVDRHFGPVGQVVGG